MKEKVWVFEKLVKDENDLHGLMAYALYKHKKHNLAVSLRQKGEDETYIEQHVKNFHDYQVDSNLLHSFQEQATNLLGKLVVQIEADLSPEHASEIEEIKKQHKKELAKAEKELINNIVRFRDDKRSFWMKTWLWLASGIPTALSALVVTAAFYALIFFTVPEETKAKVLGEALQSLSGLEIEIRSKDAP